MTEKEKAARGLLYNANSDEQLVRERRHTQDLCARYNMITPSDIDSRTNMLHSIIGNIGKCPVVEQPFFCDYGRNISAGDNIYINHNCVILDGAQVTFGDNVFIAMNCCFTTAGHPLDRELRNKGLEYAYPIKVGKNVWIGASVTVLPGVTIGDNAVIGAGSLVNRDIPSGVVAAGNPCRVLHEITEEDKETNQ